VSASLPEGVPRVQIVFVHPTPLLAVELSVAPGGALVSVFVEVDSSRGMSSSRRDPLILLL
jgi:hypothetical protein